MIPGVPTNRPPRRGGRPLDPDPLAQGDAPSDTPRDTPRDTPPGLRGQATATRDALLGLIRAHADLAKAEASEIGGEVKRAAALGGVALACAVLLGFLLPIGLALFIGEWLFGSIGWGLFHATLLLIAVAVFAILLALRVPGLARDLLVAVVIGAVIALLLGSGLPNELWRRIGDAAALGDPSWRPLAFGMLVLGIVGGLLGLSLGIRGGGAGLAVGGLVGGLVGGAALGAVLGAFSAITFGWRVGIALGVAAALAGWPVLMGVSVSRSGIDMETLKARFWPQATIDMTKETIEWAKARMPRGRRS